MEDLAEMILLLDPSTRAGRTGYRLRVKDARSKRADARHALGASRDDLPSTVDILRAATALSALLNDATAGDARLSVVFSDGSTASLAVTLSTITS